MLAQLRTEGWIHSEPFLDVARIDAVRRCVEGLAAAGWPPVFVYVYDEIWQLLRAPSLRGFLAGALGPGYRHSPRVWAHWGPAERAPPGGLRTSTAVRVRTRRTG